MMGETRIAIVEHAGMPGPRCALENRREAIGDMTRTIWRTFKHISRHEKGIQAPVWTLNLGSGSCRDLAV